MNWFEQERKKAESMKEQYPIGTRIELISMGNDPRPIESGTRGTVLVVDDLGTLHCTFDNDRCLGICPGEDSFRKLTPKEIANEQNGSEDLDDDSPIQSM